MKTSLLELVLFCLLYNTLTIIIIQNYFLFYLTNILIAIIPPVYDYGIFFGEFADLSYE